MLLQGRIAKLATVVVVVSMPLVALSAVATAKAPGCHKTHTCKSGSGTATGSGTGPSSPSITVQIDPTPLVETDQSDIVATVQVETSPSFAGDMVSVSSSQLAASCQSGVNFISNVTGGATVASVPLDDDGNATLLVDASLCAPGSDVVEVDLEAAPYDTALATLVASPPVVTASGVFGYPTTSGTVTTGEVATGDTGPLFSQSDVYAVFYVETSPVYAEQPVELSSPELESRCGAGWDLSSVTGSHADSPIGAIGPPVTAMLDDDGNAAYTFVGGSCAAGPSEVVADVLAGSHTTYTTSFTIVAPQPTI